LAFLRLFFTASKNKNGGAIIRPLISLALSRAMAFS
jgi:hypothetical protein